MFLFMNNNGIKHGGSYFDQRKLRKRICYVLVNVLVLCFIFTTVLNNFIFSTKVKSSSMEPTVNYGDVLFVTPLVSAPSKSETILENLFHRGSIARGDLVYILPKEEKKLSFFKNIVDKLVGFFTFQSFFPFSDSNLLTENAYVRRVVGFPGDTIYMKDYMLYVKHKGETHFLTEFELTGKSYDIRIDPNSPEWVLDIGIAGTFSEITLGEEEYFVLSDNRSRGTDSRFLGVVPATKIHGRVFVRTWPLRRITKL